MHEVDPLAGQVGKSREVRRCRESLSFDAAHLARRCCTALRRFAADNPAHGRIVAQALGVERSRHDRKRVEMLFAHLKRILRLGRLRLRGPRGAQFEFTLAAIAQNLRRLAKLVARPPPLSAACVA